MALRLIPNRKLKGNRGCNGSRIVGSLPVYNSIEEARKDWPDDTELWEINIPSKSEEEGR